MGCSTSKTVLPWKSRKVPAKSVKQVTPTTLTGTTSVKLADNTVQAPSEVPQRPSRETTSTTKDKTTSAEPSNLSKKPAGTLSSFAAEQSDGRGAFSDSAPQKNESKKPSAKSKKSSREKVKSQKSQKSSRRRSSKRSENSQRNKDSKRNLPRSPVSHTPKQEDDLAKTPAVVSSNLVTIPDDKVRVLGELDKTVLMRRAEIQKEIEQMDSVHEFDKTSAEKAAPPIDHDKHVKIVEEKCGVYLIAPDDQELIAQIEAAAL